MKIDLHVHSKYSRDSRLTLFEIARVAQDRAIDAVVITDHDSMEALNEVKHNPIMSGIKFFVGCEVSTTAGHILAYGLSEPPPSYMDPEFIIDYIHEHGGIAVAAHPFRNIYGIGDLVFELPFDGIEVMSNTVTKEESKTAIKTAKLLNLPSIAGSDAHHRNQLGLYYTEFKRDITSIEELIHAIKSSETQPKRNLKSYKYKKR